MKVGDKVVFRGEIADISSIFAKVGSYHIFISDLQLDEDNTEKIAEYLEVIELTGYAVEDSEFNYFLEMIRNNKEILAILALDISSLATETRRILNDGIDTVVDLAALTLWTAKAVYQILEG